MVTVQGILSEMDVSQAGSYLFGLSVVDIEPLHSYLTCLV
jgi:hypothetical protein